MPNDIERISLIQSAQQILRDRHLLIESAAGYGKSVLLTQLLSYLPQAHYIRLTIDDNDVAVLKQRIPLTDGTVFLLDDVHVLQPHSESAHWLGSQLEGNEVRYVLAGRSLPFSAANNQIRATRWDEAQLAFSPEMISHLLGSDATTDAEYEGLAGWPLGIGLLRQLPPGQQQLSLARDDLFSYLAQTVFNELEHETQLFLCTTAIPQTFSIDMACHLLESRPAQVRSQLDVVKTRNLFLFLEGERYRYHDLFREFLQAQLAPERREQIISLVIAYLNDHYHQPKSSPVATELALETQRYQQAVALILNVDHEFLNEQYRYRTVERWVRTLPEEIRDSNPALYWLTGYCLQFVEGRETDAFAYLEKAELLGESQGDVETVVATRYEMSSINYHRYGSSQEIVDQLRQITEMVDTNNSVAMINPVATAIVRAHRTLTAALSDLGRFTQARTTWQRGYNLAQQAELGPVVYEMMRRQYALYVLIPLGEFAEAQDIFRQTLAAIENNSGNRLEVLANYCDLLVAMGAWKQLDETLTEITNLTADMESLADYLSTWISYYHAWLSISRQAFSEAEKQLADMRSGLDNDAVELFSERLGQIRLHRAYGEFDEIGAIVDQVQARRQEAPFHAAQALLEADIALGLAAIKRGEPYTISPDTFTLYQFRAHGDLLRLRALLTILCHQQEQARWRILAQRVRHALNRPYYPNLLLQRDPELGAYFWRLLFIEDLAPTAAQTALIEIGRIEPLLPLLQHDLADLRQKTARLLADIGHEQAMPDLNAAHSAEKDKPTKQVIQGAITHLESLPPPSLFIQLMGTFAVQRDGQPITEFHRPIVVRLLQYFATRRGQTIGRDRILEDLWPDTDPAKAWVTFRTVYSRLRNTVEPYIRSKGPNRYFAQTGESYTFDPHGYVTVDTEQFAHVVSAALTSPTVLTQALQETVQNFQPILPDIPYADWLLEQRAYMQEIYFNISLRIGQQALAHGESAEAQRWAQRLLQDAPWMEAAWQLLMRAYARQNQRGRALRTFQDAQRALQQELAVEPSPLTQWLFQRLQNGESI